MTIKDTKAFVLQYLPFEAEIAELDRRIEELRKKNPQQSLQGETSMEIRDLQVRQTDLLKTIYTTLTPWQTVQVARHPQRPIFSDYLNLMFKDVRILHGDRCFGDDRAIVTA